MTSTWRKHLIICLFLGLLAVPVYFLDLATTQQGGRQLDHTRFPGAYLLDLHHVASHPHHLKFNWRPVVSQLRSIAYSPLLNGAFRDSSHRGLPLLRKAAPRADRLSRHFDVTNWTSEK